MAEGGVTMRQAKESTKDKPKGYEKLNKKNADGNTPLHIAALKGNIDFMKMLLKLGVSVEVQNNKGETPLHMAVESGSEDAVRCLVTAGADLQAETSDGRSVWHTAASVGNPKILKMLAGVESSVTENRIEEKDQIESNCSEAITSENVNQVNLIKCNVGSNKTEQKTELENENKCPLENKSLNGNKVEKLDSVSEMTEGSIDESSEKKLKTDINKKGNNPRKKQAKKSSDSKKAPSTPQSTENVHSSESRTLEENFEFEGENMFTRDFFFHPLMLLHEMFFSESRGHMISKNEELRIHFNNISTRNIDLNKRDHNGYTALHIAAGVGAEDAVFRFLKKKPNVNVQANNGSTPIMMAAADGSVRIIKMLIKAGADCKVKNSDNVTPLHIAAFNGKTSAVNVFLSLGLDPNIADHTGNTPLHFAIDPPINIGTVVALLKAKADIHKRNEEGITPALMAVITRNFELLRIFQLYQE